MAAGRGLADETECLPSASEPRAEPPALATRQYQAQDEMTRRPTLGGS